MHVCTVCKCVCICVCVRIYVYFSYELRRCTVHVAEMKNTQCRSLRLSSLVETEPRLARAADLKKCFDRKPGIVGTFSATFDLNSYYL